MGPYRALYGAELLLNDSNKSERCDKGHKNQEARQ